MKRRRIIRTADVTIETEENIVIRASSNGALGTGVRPVTHQGWCSVCQGEVEMVTPEQAAQIAGLGERAIFRWIEAGKLHFLETSRGIAVCVSSIWLQKSSAELKGKSQSSQRMKT